MVLPILGPALVAGGASLLGGLLRNRSTERTNESNALAVRINNRANRKAQARINRRNLKSQRRVNKQNRKSQEAINAANIAAQEKANRQNRLAQKRVNNRNIKLANRTNAQAQANFETTREDNASQLQTMVSDAESSGINPLTALRGGTAYGGVQAPVLTSPQAQASMYHAARGEAAMSQAAQAYAPQSQAPQYTALTGFSDAVSDMGVTIYNAYANQPDPEREALEMEVLRSELKRNAEQARPVFEQSFGMEIPRVNRTASEDPGSIHTDREYDLEPEKNSLWSTLVEMPDGQTVTTTNPDAFESEIFQTGSDIWKIGATVQRNLPVLFDVPAYIRQQRQGTTRPRSRPSEDRPVSTWSGDQPYNAWQ